MPWCGYWGTVGSALWWVLPLIGLVFVSVIFFACFRGFVCMGGCRRISSGLSDLPREIQGPKDEVP